VRDAVVAAVEDEWGTGLIRSWNDAGWITLSARCGDAVAQLVGAPPGSITVGDSTSIHLFNLMVAGLRLLPDRSVLVTDRANFPTDLYLAQSVARLCDVELVLLDPGDADALSAACDDRLALVSLSHVDYRTGVLHDMTGVTEQVHDAGGVMLWDLAHSAGVVPVDLLGCDVDLAVGCTYKYLNGGPGAPAYGFVHPRWQDQLDTPLTGWLGHASPFALDGVYRPAEGVGRLRIGSPPIVSMSALHAALQVYAEVDVAMVRAKSLSLTDLFIALVEEHLAGTGVEVVAPREHTRRGSQVCLRLAEAYGFVQALIARGVIGDFREPDLARFGFAPLYVRHVDVVAAVAAMAEVLAQGEHVLPRHRQRAAVT